MKTKPVKRKAEVTNPVQKKRVNNEKSEKKQGKGNAAEGKKSPHKRLDRPQDGKKFAKKNLDIIGGTEEKPNWSEMRKKKKLLKIERKKAKITEQGYEVAHKAKLLASQLQKKSIKKEVVESLCLELHNLLKGKHYTAFALSHDMSRVIQVLIKQSDEKIKQKITEELLPIIIQMIQSKYAQHCVKNMFKVGTNLVRHQVIEKFYGHVVALASHSISAPILDYVYGEFASQQEKIKMHQEFYGDMYKNTKDLNVKMLSDTYKDAPEMKVAILTATRANLQKILDKNLHDGELFHTVLSDYLKECNPENRAEMISILCPLIVPLSNSQPGADAACLCVWQATNKDKKAIMKVVKEHAVAMATHKTGYKILLAIFSSVDDTVLVKKAVVSVLMKNVQELVKTHPGKKVIHFLVKPFDPTDLHPSFIESLKVGLKNSTSKKDQETRQTELKEAVLPSLADEIVQNPQFWLNDSATALLTQVIMMSLPNELRKNVYDAVANVVCNSGWKIIKADKTVNGIEDAGLNLVIKKMVQADTDFTQEHTFVDSMSNVLSEETLKKWILSNRGCFTLVHLIEKNEKAAENVKKLLQPCRKLLTEQDGPGANLLKNIIK